MSSNIVKLLWLFTKPSLCTETVLRSDSESRLQIIRIKTQFFYKDRFFHCLIDCCDLSLQKKKCNHWAPLKISDIPLLSTLGTIEHIELYRIKIYSETLPIFMRSSLRTHAIDICCRAFKFESPRFQGDSINPPFEYEINPWTQY